MEISRRCPTCGAAVRGQAEFCPQCGEPMRRTTGAEAADVAARKTDADLLDADLDEARDSEEAGDESVIVEDDAGIAAPTLSPEDSASDLAQGRDVSAVGAGVEPRPRAKVYREPGVEHGNKRRRMTNAARGAMEDKLMPRVEKMRQSSAVMLDEAAIDPSLRFVLIAAALFAIFVVLLFISLLR